MPLTKATTNVVNLDKDTIINTLTAGKGAGNLSTNTVFGRDALQSNTIGYNNVAIGPDALQLNIDGYSNVAIGVQALEANVDGYQNVAVGRSALLVNTSGHNNVAVGDNVLNSNTIGTNNVAIGADALQSNTIGASNTAIGIDALDGNISGNYNVAVGNNALELNTIGVNNTALGRDALTANVNGSDNTAVGYAAGATSTGSENVFIGKSAAGSTTSISNQVNIYNGSVTARFTGAASAWTFTSDERDKKNIEDLNIGLDFINQLKARKFVWEMRNSEVDKGKEASGFIAQEVFQVVNDNNAAYTGLVDTSNPEQYTLAATNLIPILVKAVQELSAEVAALKAK